MEVKQVIQEFLEYMEEESENIIMSKTEEYLLNISKSHLDHEEATSFSEAILKYINIVINISSKYKEYRQQIKFCRQWLNIISKVVTNDIQTIFLHTVTQKIFDILIEEDIRRWCIKKEILKTFILCIQSVKKEVRFNTTKTLPDFYLFKIVDLISAYSDFDFQVILIEVIFRMYGKNTILPKLKDLLPESEELSESFAKINGDTFDEDVRRFLNTLNTTTGKIFSMVCKDIFIGLTKCVEPMENVGGLWVDFNLSERAVSFYRAEDLASDQSSDEDDLIWKLEMFFVSDVNFVRVYRLPQNDEAIIFMNLTVPCIDSHSDVVDSVSEAKDIKFVVSYSSPSTKKLISKILPKMFKHKFRHEATKVSITKKSVYKPLKVTVTRRSRSDSSKSKLDVSYTGRIDPLMSNSDVSSTGKHRRCSISSTSTRCEVISISDSDSCSVKSNVDLVSKLGVGGDRQRGKFNKVLEVSTFRTFEAHENANKVSSSASKAVRVVKQPNEREKRWKKEDRSARVDNRGLEIQNSDSSNFETAREFEESEKQGNGIEIAPRKDDIKEKVSSQLVRTLRSRQASKTRDKEKENERHGLKENKEKENSSSDRFETAQELAESENSENKVSTVSSKKLQTKELRKSKSKEQIEEPKTVRSDKEVVEESNNVSDRFESVGGFSQLFLAEENQDKVSTVVAKTVQVKKSRKSPIKGEIEKRKSAKDDQKDLEQKKIVSEVVDVVSEVAEASDLDYTAEAQKKQRKIFKVAIDNENSEDKVSAVSSKKLQTKKLQKSKSKEQIEELKIVRSDKKVVEENNNVSDRFESFGEFSQLFLTEENQDKVSTIVANTVEIKKSRKSLTKQQLEKQKPTKGDRKDPEKKNIVSECVETVSKIAEAQKKRRKVFEVIVDDENSDDKVSAVFPHKIQTKDVRISLTKDQTVKQKPITEASDLDSRSEAQKKPREVVEVLSDDENSANKVSTMLPNQTQTIEVRKSKRKGQVEQQKKIENDSVDSREKNAVSDSLEVIREVSKASDFDLRSVSRKKQNKAIIDEENTKDKVSVILSNKIKIQTKDIRKSPTKDQTVKLKRISEASDLDSGSEAWKKQREVIEVVSDDENSANKVSTLLPSQTQTMEVRKSKTKDSKEKNAVSDRLKVIGEFSEASDLDARPVSQNKQNEALKVINDEESTEYKVSVILPTKIQIKKLQKPKNEQQVEEKASVESDTKALGDKNSSSDLFETARTEFSQASDLDIIPVAQKKQKEALEVIIDEENGGDKVFSMSSDKIQTKTVRKSKNKQQMEEKNNSESDKADQIEKTVASDCSETVDNFAEASDLALKFVIEKNQKSVPEATLNKEENKDGGSTMSPVRTQPKDVQKSKKKQQIEGQKEDLQRKKTVADHLETIGEFSEVSDLDLGVVAQKKQRKDLEETLDSKNNKDKASQKQKENENQQHSAEKDEEILENLAVLKEIVEDITQTKEERCLPEKSAPSLRKPQKKEVRKRKKHQRQENKENIEETTQSSLNVFSNDSDVVTVISTQKRSPQAKEDPFVTSGGYDLLDGVARKGMSIEKENRDAKLINLDDEIVQKPKRINRSRRIDSSDEDGEDLDDEIVQKSRRNDRSRRIDSSDEGAEDLDDEIVQKPKKINRSRIMDSSDEKLKDGAHEVWDKFIKDLDLRNENRGAKDDEIVRKCTRSKRRRIDSSEEELNGAQEMAVKSTKGSDLEKMEDVFNMGDLLEKPDRKNEPNGNKIKDQEHLEEIKEEIAQKKETLQKGPDQESEPATSEKVEEREIQVEKLSRDEEFCTNKARKALKITGKIKNRQNGVKKMKKQVTDGNNEDKFEKQTILDKKNQSDFEKIVAIPENESIDVPRMPTKALSQRREFAVLLTRLEVDTRLESMETKLSESTPMSEVFSIRSKTDQRQECEVLFDKMRVEDLVEKSMKKKEDSDSEHLKTFDDLKLQDIIEKKVKKKKKNIENEKKLDDLKLEEPQKQSGSKKEEITVENQDLPQEMNIEATDNTQAIVLDSQGSNAKDRQGRYSQETALHDCAARQVENPVETIEKVNEIEEQANPEEYEDIVDEPQRDEGNKTVFNQTTSTTLGRRKLYNPNDLTYLENVADVEEIHPRVEEIPSVSNLKEKTVVEPIEVDVLPVGKGKRVNAKKSSIYSVKKQKKAKIRREKLKITPRSDVTLHVHENPEKLRLKSTFFKVLESFRKDLKTSLPEIIRMNQTSLEESPKEERRSEKRRERRHRRRTSEIVVDRVVRKEVESNEMDVSLKLKKDENIAPKKKIHIISDVRIRPKRALLEDLSNLQQKKAKTVHEVEEIPVDPGIPHQAQTITETRAFFKYLSMCPALEKLVQYPNDSEEYSDAFMIYNICKKYHT